MRPKSIVRFERLFLFSLALGLVNGFLQYASVVRRIESDPALASLGGASNYAAITLAISLAIPLLLWYLIARRASNTAKWVLVAITLVGLWFIFGAAARMSTVSQVATVAVTAMQLAAIYFLFRPDAKAWLTAHDDVEPAD